MQSKITVNKPIKMTPELADLQDWMAKHKPEDSPVVTRTQFFRPTPQPKAESANEGLGVSLL